MSSLVRPARLADISAMTRLIEQRREDYERVQPVFWKRAAASSASTAWYYRSLLLFARRSLILVAEDEGRMLGFLIARPARTPPVYDPGGATGVIDDFCVADPREWTEIGGALLADVRAAGRKAGWSQIVVVCGAHDEPKASFLRSAELSIVSNWWRGAI
jgi:GNAT superfamily N-acetyltransferase